MQKTQSLAFFSLSTAILAVITLCLVAAALQDIWVAMEPSPSSQWNVVKIGIPIFIVLHILSLGGFFKMLKTCKQEE